MLRFPRLNEEHSQELHQSHLYVYSGELLVLGEAVQLGLKPRELRAGSVH